MPKSKYSESFKLSVIDYVQSGNSKYSASKHYGIHKTIVAQWVSHYQQHGIEGIKLREHSPTRYTGAFKVSVVEYRLLNNLSFHEVMSYFNISSLNVVLRWERKYMEQDSQALMDDKRGRPRTKTPLKQGKDPKLQESREEELYRLRMENEYLKKLNALVLAKENPLRHYTVGGFSITYKFQFA